MRCLVLHLFLHSLETSVPHLPLSATPSKPAASREIVFSSPQNNKMQLKRRSFESALHHISQTITKKWKDCASTRPLSDIISAKKKKWRRVRAAQLLWKIPNNKNGELKNTRVIKLLTGVGFSARTTPVA